MTLQESEQLKAILMLVKSRVREGAKVTVYSFIMPDKPGGVFAAYIGFVPYENHLQRMKNNPGIPYESLYKTEAIADWIIRQIGKDRPEWFG